MMSIRWLLFSFLIALATTPAFAETHLRADGDTVIFEDSETGESIWSFRHQSLQPDDERWKPQIQQPVHSDGRWFYFVGADVLEFDPGRAAIVARTHFSLFVEDLRFCDEGALEVVLSNEERH